MIRKYSFLCFLIFLINLLYQANFNLLLKLRFSWIEVHAYTNSNEIRPLFSFGFLLQGISYWNVKNNLSPTDRNMQVRFGLKVVLEFWKGEIFGITTNFYEMLTERHLLDQI